LPRGNRTVSEGLLKQGFSAFFLSRARSPASWSSAGCDGGGRLGRRSFSASPAARPFSGTNLWTGRFPGRRLGRGSCAAVRWQVPGAAEALECSARGWPCMTRKDIRSNDLRRVVCDRLGPVEAWTRGPWPRASLPSTPWPRGCRRTRRGPSWAATRAARAQGHKLLWTAVHWGAGADPWPSSRSGQVVGFRGDQVVMGGGQVVGCRCIRDYLPRGGPAGVEGCLYESFHPSAAGRRAGWGVEGFVYQSFHPRLRSFVGLSVVPVCSSSAVVSRVCARVSRGSLPRAVPQGRGGQGLTPRASWGPRQIPRVWADLCLLFLLGDPAVVPLWPKRHRPGREEGGGRGTRAQSDT